MKPLSKIFTCTLILAMIVSTLAESANAFTPSEPEFTIKFVDNSYTKPKTYTTDPYTGEVFANAGEQVVNQSLIVTIKNQPFTPYMDLSGNLTQLYYNVLWKPHYGDLWNGDDNPQSNGEYTEVAIASGGSVTGKGGLIDIKLQVLIGYWVDAYIVYGEFSMGMAMQGYYDRHDFIGEKYNGTVIQTYDLSNGKVTYATISDATSSVTPTETPADNSTLTTNPDNGTQQTGNPPTDNPVANDAADGFSLGDFKLGIGEIAVLMAVSVVVGALVTLGLTRRTKQRKD